MHTPVLTPLPKPFPLHSLSSGSLLVELVLIMQGPTRSLPNYHNLMSSLLSLDHMEFYKLPLQHFTLYEVACLCVIVLIDAQWVT